MLKYFWQKNTLVRISVIVHLLALLAIVIKPAFWPWIGLVVLINHIIVAAAGLWPRSQCLGVNWSQLPKQSIDNNEIALTIDDGPDPIVTPKVLEILEQYQVKATFFCIGDKAEQYPEICKDIVQRGHAIENHTQHHRHHFSLLGPNGFLREISAAQHTLATITGQTPQFFRAPAGLRNPFLAPVLCHLKLTLASWSVRAFDTQHNHLTTIKNKLLSGLKPGAILLIHDGNAANSQNGVPVILEVLPELLAAAASLQLKFVTLRQTL